MIAFRVCVVLAVILPVPCLAQSAGPMFPGAMPPATIGDTGRINKTIMACPARGQVNIFNYSMRNARQASDPAFAQDAMEAALESGCRELDPTDQGSIMAFSGPLKGWIQLRMDDDKQVYWTSHRAVTDIPPTGLPDGYTW